MYRVLYLAHARRAVAEDGVSLAAAIQSVAFYKRRGFTAWVEKLDGEFVPVKGATRLPKWIAD